MSAIGGLKTKKFGDQSDSSYWRDEPYLKLVIPIPKMYVYHGVVAARFAKLWGAEERLLILSLLTLIRVMRVIIEVKRIIATTRRVADFQLFCILSNSDSGYYRASREFCIIGVIGNTDNQRVVKVFFLH